MGAIRFLSRNLLLVFTLGGVALGLVVGLSLRSAHLSHTAIELLAFPGELFMNVLKALVLPLIASGIIAGLSQLELNTSRRLLLLFAGVSALFMLMGIVEAGLAMVLVHPGDPAIKKHQQEQIGDSPGFARRQGKATAMTKIMDILRNLMPDNLIRATFQQVHTELVPTGPPRRLPTSSNNLSLPFNEEDELNLIEVRSYIDAVNLIGVVAFCIAMALIMATMQERASPLIRLFAAVEAVIARFLRLVLWLSPVGIGSLIAGELLLIDDFAHTAQTLGLYVAATMGAQAFQVFLLGPLAYFLLAHRNPLAFLRGQGETIVTGLGISSTAATLPTLMNCLEQRNGVDEKYSRTLVPLGIAMNMVGSLIYKLSACYYLMQTNGMEMSLGNILITSFTGVMFCIGTPAIPGGSLIIVMVMLGTLGMDASDISFVWPVDFILDRTTTVCNTINIGYAAAIVEAIAERAHAGHLTHDKQHRHSLLKKNTSSGSRVAAAETGDLPMKQQHYNSSNNHITTVGPTMRPYGESKTNGEEWQHPNGELVMKL